ncbi:dual specificity protein phosphatase 16 [Patella vulgata]|uniref:dual specificity protein phosphatase 16 n=1 Tax=Patella vulgata TaxID=6465 RepID=UPI0024A9FFC0|nr:dual specificity protein phosphatase 16 [Patella vulgata]
MASKSDGLYGEKDRPMECSVSWDLLYPQELAKTLREGGEKVLLVDSRSFLEYNTSHIQQAVNVCGSKLVKRRLQQDKVRVKDLLIFK